MAAETAEAAVWVQGGVYAITNTATGEQYVGSAAMFGIRWCQHVAALRANRHTTPQLQQAWADAGEDAFAFTVLEIVTDRAALIEREQAWINDLRPVYNTRQNVFRPDSVWRHPEPTRLPDQEVPRLRKWRIRALLKQSELAERAGIARSTIVRGERGDPISFESLKALAQALGITLEELRDVDPDAALKHQGRGVTTR
jgi:DNA-binding XRE family transcriptional regulator